MGDDGREGKWEREGGRKGKWGRLNDGGKGRRVSEGG